MRMRRIVAVSVILFLASGVLGLSFSTCRSFMANTPQIRMASCCADDDFCNRMCLLGQDDYPALLQTARLEFQATLGPPLAASTSVASVAADQPRQQASLGLAEPGPAGDVYLFNSTFLI